MRLSKDTIHQNQLQLSSGYSNQEFRLAIGGRCVSELGKPDVDSGGDLSIARIDGSGA